MFDKFKLYFFLILLCVFFSVLSPIFFTWDNFINILLSATTIGLLSIGAAFVIAGAGIDLSVGSLLALSAAVASCFVDLSNSWILIIFVCLLTGVIFGALNGFFVAYLGLPSFIVTLGMLSIARGLSLVVTNGMPVYGLPEKIVFIGQGSIFGIPVPVLILVLAAYVFHLMLRKTVFGSRVLCLGDNSKAVFNAGIDIKKLTLKLYILSGFLAALAGLIFMGRVNAADPNAGVMYELTAITAAILGGTHLFGGKASIVGAMVGALIMGILQNGLTLLAVPSYYQQLAIGAVLILAVSVDKVLEARK